ncbi:aldehyde dehydrogenase family protein [Oceanobacillus sp. FSL H7-0719]|uniref:aldehyde dehydrogenase family protein n=1 Tax=Oceanobacillus sp. FSL H7-0719 TaxID=2954507 RepID=UPI003254D169
MSAGITLTLESSLLEQRKKTIEDVITYLKENKSSVRKILTEISTYQTAEDEIDTSIRVLENAYREVKLNKPKTLNKMTVFMPSNVILYSYVLYLLIPSLYVNEIEFRSSSLVIDQLRRLHKLLGGIHQLPIQLQELSHRKFIKASALSSNIVVFTGEYKNAEKIKFQLSPDQLFVFFGQGVNPFIITESANIDKAVKDLIKARMYNTGQDCMGPDAIFVQKSKSQQFIETLVNRLGDLKIGENTDPEADYGKIHYLSTLDSVGSYLNENSEWIAYGGNINYRNKVIEPTVLHSSIENDLKLEEFFSPLFNVISYQSIDELKNTFQKGYFLERAMGASIYGEEVEEIYQELSRKHVVSVNQNLFDIENGNEPFGGYGPMANYVSYKNQLHIKPILLSNVVYELMNDEEYPDESN